MVLKSIDDIVKANERLQEQLATAEVRLQRQAAELETQTTVARTDPLTLLSNRRALDDEMNRRLAEWQRRKTTFSLAMIDVDHFKKLNDKHGHQAGDQVLRDVAATLGTTVREMDLAARYGGEEFAIILPSTPLADAVQRGRADSRGHRDGHIAIRWHRNASHRLGRHRSDSNRRRIRQR